MSYLLPGAIGGFRYWKIAQQYFVFIKDCICAWFWCAWRKRLWEFSYPGAEQQQQQNLRVSGRRGLQAAAQHADYHALPFSGMDQGNSLPYWEPPPNPTRLWLILDASTPPMF
jgi:hypothetical protein